MTVMCAKASFNVRDLLIKEEDPGDSEVHKAKPDKDEDEDKEEPDEDEDEDKAKSDKGGPDKDEDEEKGLPSARPMPAEKWAPRSPDFPHSPGKT